MKKIVLFVVSSLLMTSLLAQDSTASRVTPKSAPPRANDHFMIQYGYAGWSGIPDTINAGGFSKTFNVFFMLNLPFRTNPKLSMAIGGGIASDHIKFKDTYVGIKERTATLPFVDQSDTNHFKKTKLVTTYLEAPLELRYTKNPENSDKSFKFAVGLRAGLLINAHTRNKGVRNKEGSTIDDYTMKEHSKRFFNTTRFVGTARVGWGHFSLFGSYQLNALFKEGVGPDVKPFSIGLTLSGL
ncbi:MAG: outer membrane beta-barrel protein [Pedobacter agri]